MATGYPCYLVFLPVNVPSPMSPKLIVPFIVSLSTVPVYMTCTVVPSAVMSYAKLVSFPLAVPVSAACPYCPLYCPVSFSPSCLKVTVGLPLPKLVLTSKLHVPVTSILSCAAGGGAVGAAGGGTAGGAGAAARVADQSPPP